MSSVRKPSVWAAAAFFFLVTSANDGSAEAPPASFEFDYVAPAGCPDETAFRASVAKRTDRAWPRSVRVVIGQNGEAFDGRLEISADASMPSERHVTLAQCDDTVEALALSLALQIERQPTPNHTPPQAVTPQPDAAVTLPVPDSLVVWRWIAGVGLRAAWGRGDGARPETSVFVGARRVDGWWSAGGQLAFWRSSSGEIVTSGPGTAQFELLGGRLTACPVGYEASWWAAQTCLELEIARLDSAGRLDAAGNETRAWAGTGGLLQAELNPISGLRMAVFTGLTAPLVRYRLQFLQPTQKLYETSSVGPYVGGSVFVAWP